MKTCKIILIILLVFKVIINIGRTMAADSDEQFSCLVATFFHAVVMSLFYLGAGIFDI